ncbi:spherulation-specific family 4 protein [Streptomyces sp. WAC 00631]|uniref:spherulation-specific family 4 protein n=1 Tax=Streptomyces sp. WAC 00631 TaxID=2203201 RepID=UPI000F7B46DA|nr:spherulation-specific family 4 protein [Streptomyces sp. WAC 00631]MCC5035404.1 spherulation-specific family 4 protein [Streptomyces sp. WAC 00631]
MSSLTRSGPRREVRAAAAARPGVGVPGCAHPLLAPAEWAALTRPHTPLDWAVLDVARGPGALPDPRCLEAAGRLRNGGVRVLGLLDLGHGTRPFGEIVRDARRFTEWYRTDGFYLRRCPGRYAALDGVRRLADALLALRQDAHLVLEHGLHPDPGFAEIPGCQLVTFAGPWAEYRWSQAPEWTAEYPPERFCHLVHCLPRGHLEEALRTARWLGAGTVYFTDRTDRGDGGCPWETLPGYWDEFVSRIGTRVSE